MAMKICKDCGTEISKGAKTCPKCGREQRDFFQKHPILTFCLIVFIFASVGSSMNDTTNTTTSNNKYESNSKVEVVVADFSTMEKTDIQTWCDTNKVNLKIIEEYSDTIEKGKFISQSTAPNSVIYQGDKITFVYSLGREPSNEEKNALAKAETYSQMMNMSKQGIYNQLTSFAEGFTKEAAQYAIDNIDADWNANALAKAKTYQQTMNMSKQGIYNQLTSFAEGFTKEEAQYAIDHLED